MGSSDVCCTPDEEAIMSGYDAKVIALIDCNNFFVSCERVFRPDTWNRPVAVLSNNDGCIIARSNEVKSLGVPMGVPLFQVRDVLERNSTVLFSANFGLYGDMSQRITSLISGLSPTIEVYSVDESFADLSSLGSVDYERWAKETKEMIWHCTGVPVSIGIGPSKTLAKAAAEYAKKEASSNGVHVALSEADRATLLSWLPVEDIWGIGRRYAPKLRDQGVRTAQDLAGLSDKWILKELTTRGLTTATELRGRAVLGFDDDSEGRKSIGRSRAFGHTIHSFHQLESAVATFTAQAAVKLRSQGSVAGSVVTYLKTSRRSESYQSLTTTTPLSEPSADTGRLIRAALRGLESIYDKDFSYQKAGIMLSDITSQEAWQLSLLEPDGRRDKKAGLMRSIDKLNNKYGASTVWHAAQDIQRSQWQSKHEKRSPNYTTSWSDLPVLKG